MAFNTGFVFVSLLWFIQGSKSQNEGVSVEMLHIQSSITSRFANTLITSQVRNTGDSARQITFDVNLPKTAFISNFSMTIDGVVYYGNLKEKEEALKQYNQAKKRGESAGLIKQQPRDANRFKVAVNVAAEKTVTFNLTYQDLLQRKLGLYDHVIYLSPSQIIPDFKVDIFITESRKITELKEPILKEIESNEVKSIPADVNWISDNSVHIAYQPSVEEQEGLFKYGTIITSQSFVIKYDVQRSLDAGELMAVDGYFVHFVAPKDLNPLPKKIVFVMDTSSSMTGHKTVQMKQAMLTILDDLREQDTFSIIGFSDSNEIWKESLVPVTANTIKEATKFVEDDLNAYGGTDIGNGMLAALKILKQDSVYGIPMIMFLTDGQPTNGISNKGQLLHTITETNNFAVRIMSLAFGEGADYNLLQKVSAANYGLARKIYEAADAPLQVSTFYDEVSTPVLAEVKVKYLDSAIEEDSITTTDFSTLFKGSELVISGKLSETTGQTIDLSLEGKGAEGTFELEKTVPSQTLVPRPPSAFSDLSGFTERLWAYLSIQQLLERRVLANTTQLSEIKGNVTDLSLKYGFVTPYTSMVVTKPQKKKMASNDKMKDSEAESDMDSPNQKSSPWKPSSGYADNDPHFMMALPGLKLPVCFDVMGQDQEVWNLLTDPVTGVRVYGKMFQRDLTSKRTFFGAILVRARGYVLILKPDVIKINHTPIKWRENLMIRWKGKQIGFFGKNNVTLYVTKDTNVVILRHTLENIKEGKIKYLGFYLNNAKGLSNRTTGLLGSFLNRVVLSADISQRADGKYVAQLSILDTASSRSKEELVESRLRHRPDLEHDVMVNCWHLKKEYLDNHVIRHSDHRVFQQKSRLLQRKPMSSHQMSTEKIFYGDKTLNS